MKNILTALFVCAMLMAQAQTPAAAPTQRPAPLKSPETTDAGTTFRLRAPNATAVTLDIEGISREIMVKDDKGVWSFTKKLAPDVYDYAFEVDGLRMPDPINPVEKPCYQCNGQSLAHVPGPASISWEIKDVPRGAIVETTYRSAVMGEDRRYMIYLPPNYDAKRKEPYPVFFLLHGATGTEESWIINAQANIILDNLIAEGKAKPMIMINTLGYGGNEKYATQVLQEIVPQLEKNYNVSKDRAQHAIAGLSMGGGTTLFTGLNHLEYFSYIGAFSSAVAGPPRAGAPTASAAPAAGAPAPPTAEETYAKQYPKVDEKVNSQIKLLWIACGKQDFLIENNRTFKKWLSSKNVKYTDVEFEGAHTFMVWRRNLTDFAPLLFK